MLELLEQAENMLPLVLRNPEGWHSKLIDYHPPKVERLWREWQGYRIMLHRIYPCESSEALWHPHNWPSAMRVVEGKYEMGVSYGREAPTGLGARIILPAGATYEMVYPLGWHYVRPLGEPTLSVMIVGPRYDEPLDAPSTKGFQFPELEPEVIEGLLHDFRRHY